MGDARKRPDQGPIRPSILDYRNLASIPGIQGTRMAYEKGVPVPFFS